MVYAQRTDHEGKPIGDPFEVSDNVLWSTSATTPSVDMEPDVEWSIEIRGTGPIDAAYTAAADALNFLRSDGATIDYSSIHTCPTCTREPKSDTDYYSAGFDPDSDPF